MGRVAWQTEFKIEIEILIQELKKIETLFSLEKNGIKCYIFGSSLNKKCPNDFDILVLYDSEEHLSNIKQGFKSIAKSFPLHLNYFTFLEEEELNFIEQQNAREIF